MLGSCTTLKTNKREKCPHFAVTASPISISITELVKICKMEPNPGNIRKNLIQNETVKLHQYLTRLFRKITNEQNVPEE